MHNSSIVWLRERLNKTFDGKTIVVTHHGPSKRCIHKKFGGGELAGGFYSDLPELLNKPDIWIYGHTHSNLDISIDGMRLISNQRGYPTEDIPDFKPELMLEI